MFVRRQLLFTSPMCGPVRPLLLCIVLGSEGVGRVMFGPASAIAERFRRHAMPHGASLSVRTLPRACCSSCSQAAHADVCERLAAAAEALMTFFTSSRVAALSEDTQCHFPFPPGAWRSGLVASCCSSHSCVNVWVRACIGASNSSVRISADPRC